jgi:hypothetical protein
MLTLTLLLSVKRFRRFWVHIPADADHHFRLIATTDSD